jgi:hypothetical protein
VFGARGSSTEEGDWQELARNKDTKKTATTKKLSFLMFFPPLMSRFYKPDAPRRLGAQRIALIAQNQRP